MAIPAQANKNQLLSPNGINIFKIVSLGIFSLFLMQLDQSNKLSNIKYYTDGALYPIKTFSEIPSVLGRKIKTWTTQKSELLTLIDQLQNRQLLLEFEVQKNASLQAENSRLKMLLKASNDLKQPSLIAEIITLNSNPYRHLITLNRGSNDGIFVNQPILDTSGIVGQVTQVGPFSSEAILISDPQHAFSIQVNRNGVRGLAQGTGNFQSINILNIPINEDIKIGDLLISSGLDERFPQGYPVAVVTSIEHDPTSYFAKITAKPTAQLNKVREVLVIKNIETPSDEIAQ